MMYRLKYRVESEFIPFLNDMDSLFLQIQDSVGELEHHFFMNVGYKLQSIYAKWTGSVIQGTPKCRLINSFFDLNDAINLLINCICEPLKQIINYFLGKHHYLSKKDNTPPGLRPPTNYSDLFSLWRMIIDGLGDQAVALTSPHLETREFALIWNKCLSNKLEYHNFMYENSLPCIDIILGE